MRSMNFQCNFMDKSYVGLIWAVSVGLVVFNGAGMLMYDMALKTRLQFVTHFHTWLPRSPGF